MVVVKSPLHSSPAFHLSIRRTGEGRVAKNILKFIVPGVVLGVVIGWLLSLVSGNYFVTLGVATIGLLVGVVLGIVHRNDP